MVQLATFAISATLLVLQVNAQDLNSTSAGNSTSIEDAEIAQIVWYNNMIMAHEHIEIELLLNISYPFTTISAILMAWVFLLVVPLSIVGMRYARHILAAWCFRTHAVSMGVFAGVPLVTAFVLGYLATTPDNFTETHT
ncbi:hypothetical protein BC937DRAFT_92025, partial [Endogone sp. FLAS-F59071]